MSEQSQATSQSSFFNLHVEGVGYLNRVRTVKPKKGQEFLACNVAAMRGSTADLSYTKFDCKVSGAEAQKIVKMLEADVAAEKLPVAGRVIWVTPKGAQGKRTAGIGVQFSDQDRGQTQKKIETYLAGALSGDKATHTM